MNELILSTDDDFQFQLPVLLAINNYSGPLYHQDYNLPHPGALIQSRWRSLVNRINIFFEAYDEYLLAIKNHTHPKSPYTPKIASDPSLEKIISEYKNILYEATELIENMKDNLKLCFLPKERHSEWRPNILRKWREYPTIICNKLKHNHNLLVPVEADYTLGKVKGFALCHYVGGEALKPNLDVHEKAFPFSFGNDLRRILSHIYLIGNALFHELDRLFPATPEYLRKDTPSSEHLDFLNRVSSFMPLTFHHYKKENDIAVFKFLDNKTLKIDTNGGSIYPTGQGVLKTTYSGDGYTKTFHLF